MVAVGSAAALPLATEEEFLRLPESLQKVELIDGEIIVSPSPDYWHQEILRRIVFALGGWALKQRKPVAVCQSPLDVRFGRGRILQPDAFILFGAVARSHKGPVDRVPELCIEVISSNRVHDRITKRLVYAAAGVKEYWVVDPGGIIERWTGPGLSKATAVRSRLTTTLLPGFSLDLPALFASRGEA